ncbi:hypothetical protein E1264_19430 [Actinomadura sp. KC216]|uniref:hypothetical protein n=1 Tax=Actinomadura sp. KC216 TaxID=2530370 RepID=UPI00104FBBAB|nr:hypothetical protein [Actinomadura sp. KC216]TDB85953.1 hypothetical protein E1264_19430 [Actinomadura sp. KC216]
MEDGSGEGDAPGRPLTRRRVLKVGACGVGVLYGVAVGFVVDPFGGDETPQSRRTTPSGRYDAGDADTVLGNRARAVRTGDRTAFLATVGSAPAAFQDAQARLYGNLRKLPLAGWHEQVTATQAVDEENGVTVVRVKVRYKLRGFDSGEGARTRYLALTQRSGTWTIVGDGSAYDFHDDAEIWDAGRLSVVEGRASLVIGDAAGLDEIAERLDAAVPAVDDVVGTGWARRAVALVPADEALAAALAGPGQGAGEFAAVATTVPPAGFDPGGDRVVIAPGAFGRLNELGRGVVLTHELTHVATGAATDRTTPGWLIEGFADYVGYRGSEIGVRAAAGELRREVAAGRIPSALPAAAAFSGGSARLSQAYQEAWLACRMIADRYGEATLVRLYRTAGRVPEATALREVLGLTPQGFTARWRDYLKKELT